MTTCYDLKVPGGPKKSPQNAEQDQNRRSDQLVSGNCCPFRQTSGQMADPGLSGKRQIRSNGEVLI